MVHQIRGHFLSRQPIEPAPCTWPRKSSTYSWITAQGDPTPPQNPGRRIKASHLTNLLSLCDRCVSNKKSIPLDTFPSQNTSRLRHALGPANSFRLKYRINCISCNNHAACQARHTPVDPSSTDLGKLNEPARYQRTFYSR
jgi:hypothetical protein